VIEKLGLRSGSNRGINKANDKSTKARDATAKAQGAPWLVVTWHATCSSVYTVSHTDLARERWRE